MTHVITCPTCGNKTLEVFEQDAGHIKDENGDIVPTRIDYYQTCWNKPCSVYGRTVSHEYTDEVKSA